MFLLGMVTGMPESVLMVVRMGSMRSTTPTTTAGSKRDPLRSDQPRVAGQGGKRLLDKSMAGCRTQGPQGGLKVQCAAPPRTPLQTCARGLC